MLLATIDETETATAVNPASESPSDSPVSRTPGFEPPVLRVMEPRKPSLPDKVVQLQDHRARQRDSLTPGEQAAFQEIARKLDPLGLRAKVEQSLTPSEPPALRSEPAPQPPKAPETPQPAEPIAVVPSPPSEAALAAGDDRDCILAPSAWKNPISPKELMVARDILAAGNAGRAEVVTGQAFTDSGLKQREDLDEYRVIHFATHGIVTPPQKKCPAQPALLTSFGGQGSDGLLTFREIFDLKLNADLVILSACDTASKASTAATREAGLSSGGDVELDGLVRAFVAAGGRTVLASHWPVPDDFNATQRLITGLFTAPAGTPVATALRLSQQKLMDDPATSHPFYWSAFAPIGDGSVPVVRKAPQAIAAR